MISQPLGLTDREARRGEDAMSTAMTTAGGGVMSDSMLMPAPTAQTSVQVIDRGMLPVAEVVSRVRRIQEVMQALMKEGTHYGTIPGTPKPTLYQPGAELLCLTFRIAASPRVEDLSTPDTVRYRVTMQATNQITGEMLGEGVGECSSDETKYRWARPTCDEEWADTPEDQRREKWMRKGGGAFKAKQVRVSPADVANTILKMASKRALIAMTRTVLACSDQFAQGLEDLPEEVRESVAEHQGGASTGTPRVPQAPQRKPAANGNGHAAPKAARVTVKDVQKKTGESNGKPWTVYLVSFSDGRTASTFDEAMSQLAAQAKQDNAPVEATVQAGRKEGTWNLTELVRVEREPGDDDVF